MRCSSYRLSVASPVSARHCGSLCRLAPARGLNVNSDQISMCVKTFSTADAELGKVNGEKLFL